MHYEDFYKSVNHSILQYIVQYITVYYYAVYCGMYSLCRVIVEGECVQDWSSKMVEIKRSFVQLPDLLHSTRGKGQQPAASSSSLVPRPCNPTLPLHYNVLMIESVSLGTGLFQSHTEEGEWEQN